jgi:inner membrane protein
MKRIIHSVDSLSHAFVVSLLFPSSADSVYLFAAVLGAIIPDIDILFQPLSDNHPSLFILTHGGFTHSIAGAAVVAVLAWCGIFLGVMAGAFPFGDESPLVLLLILYTGACSHLVLDILASPGIPLFYPLLLKKFTLGIFPGPSIVLFFASIVYAAGLAMGAGSESLAGVYAVFFSGVLLLSAGIWFYTKIHNRGVLIPTFHPFKWLVIRDENTRYILEGYNLLRGKTYKGTYAKFKGMEAGDLQGIEDIPAVKRLRYYSYIVTAERTESGILLQDPLRKEKILFYPPHYAEVLVPDSPAKK